MANVVAITGAAGTIGQKLSFHLENHESVKKIIQIDIKEKGGQHPKIEFIRADIRHPFIPDVLRSHNVDILIHLAFQSEPFKRSGVVRDADVIGTMKLLNACSAARVKKVIVPSTTAVYGAYPDNPGFLHEKLQLKPVRSFPTIRDRLEVENLCLNFAQKHPTVIVSILRFCPIITSNPSNLFSNLMRLPCIPVLMGFDPLLQFIHEDDVVKALELAITTNISGIFNIVGDGVIPLSKIIRLLDKTQFPIPTRYVLATVLAFMLQISILHFPMGMLDYLKYTWVADGAKANRELGFIASYSSEKAIIEFIENYRIKDFVFDPHEELFVPDINEQENLESFIDSRVKKIIDEGLVQQNSET